jgi:hypothetical protein
MTADTYRALLRRFLKILGLSAAGTGLMTVGGQSEVFARMFLKETVPVTQPEMVYDPHLQLMVRPGTDDPIFQYSDKILRGKENGEYKVAPLVTKTSPPPPPPPPRPLPKVTPGPQGPHAD